MADDGSGLLASNLSHAFGLVDFPSSPAMGPSHTRG